jgi:hypothetical protein
VALELVALSQVDPIQMGKGASRRARTAVRHLQAALSLSGDWICRTTWPGRVSTWPGRMPSCSRNAFAADSRWVRRIDQDARRRNMQGGGQDALRGATASAPGDA